MILLDTIVSEATPPLKGAISIIRMSGKLSFDILSKMVDKDINSLKPRYMYYASIYQDKDDESSLIDKSMFVIFKGKNSYTGEDSVEFYVHGSRIIVSQIVQACCKYGARQALGGEFTQKAFYNGKMDLAEAEAVNQLINAQTLRSKNFALKTLEGTSSKYIQQMKEKINMIEAEIEVNIDYPEYDDEDELIEKVSKLVPELINQAKKLVKDSKQTIYLFNGVNIAIIGEPNVGKSTLLNKILGKDKAIVTNIPGTTRDVVEGEKEVDGILYHFYDTAGIRSADDQIEQIGIEKSYEIAKQADIILVLSDKKDFQNEIKTLGISEIIKDKPSLFISTKKDLFGEDKQADISISKDDENLVDLFNLINKKLDITSKEDEGFSSQREIDILNKFVEELESILIDIKLGMKIDIVEIKLVEASSLLDSLLSVESTMEDIYQTIFKHFCVGK